MQRRTTEHSFRPRHWSRVGLAVIAGSAALLLAGCTGGGDAGPTPTATTVSSVDNLTVSMPGPITGVDPANTILQQNVWFVHLLGGNLFAAVPGSSSDVVPALAQSGTLADDGLSAVVTLKPNLKFSDGTPLTQNDVVATYTRDLTGKNIGALFYAGITGVEASGTDGVKFTFANPNPNYQAQLSQFPFAILPADSWNKPDFVTNPVMAGQYMAQGDITGNTATLVANPNYPGPKPSVQKLTFNVIADADAAANQLVSGQLDWATQVLPTRVATLDAGGTDSTQINESWGISVVTPNDSDPILSDVKVRQAIGDAIDRTQLAQIVSSGTGDPQTGPLAPNFPGSTDAANQVFSATADTAKAKTELAGTACATGCSFELLTSTATATAASTATVLQQQLAAIGIKLTIVSVDQTTFNTRVFAKNFQIVLTGGGAFGYSPTLALMLNPQGPTKAMFSQWPSTTISAALLAANTASSADQGTALTNVVKVFAQDVPWVPLLSNPQISAVKAEYANQIFFSPTGVPDVATLP
ncbi:ABC transporter substrate-binding protein [Subtercola sp. YIM 133946]|uniref:ABC transporter substrate-binding protein n=1 Tax=Subtercola sp. YIM 133946 TaxID=3118909 RepID=UPI002F957956